MKSQENGGPGVLQIFAHNRSLRFRGNCLVNLRLDRESQAYYSVNSSTNCSQKVTTKPVIPAKATA